MHLVANKASNGVAPLWDEQAERAVIGAALADAAAFDRAKLAPGDFFSAPHRAIWTAMLQLRHLGKPTDGPLVLPLLPDVAMVALSECLTSGYTVDNVEHYAEVVATHALTRRARVTLSELAHGGLEGAELVARAQDELGRLARPALGSSSPIAPQAADAMAEALWATAIPPATPTGLAHLDAIIGGLRPESFIVLNGPPGRGKSGLAIQMTRHVAVGRPVVFITTELSARQVLARFVAQVRGVPWGAVYDTGPSEALAMAADLSDLQLRIVELTRSLDIFGTLDRVAQELGEPPVFVLDYMQHAARKRADEERRIAVAALSDEVGEWCRRTRSTALMVGSTARFQYTSENDRSAGDFLGTAKESGDVDYDASAILFLESEGTSARLHVAKNRFGPDRKTVGLRFDGAIGMFTDDPLSGLSVLERRVLVSIGRGATTANGVFGDLGGKRGHVLAAIKAVAQKDLIDRAPMRVIGAALDFVDSEDFE